MLDIDATRPGVEPRDAATVILLRDADRGMEVFLVRRHTKSGFMGGAHVFPGGKLDHADCGERAARSAAGHDIGTAAVALGEPEEPKSLGLFVAAARETFEEARILLADVPPEVDVGAAWERLHAGAPFLDLIEELGVPLRLDRLVPLSRWVTPAVEKRRYDTRFFLTRVPADQEAAHDRHETTEAVWLQPAEAIEKNRHGEILLPPPTLRTLELLALHADAASALRDAASRKPPTVGPVLFPAPDITLVLPGDPEHPEPKRAIAGGTRFVLVDGHWESRDP